MHSSNMWHLALLNGVQGHLCNNGRKDDTWIEVSLDQQDGAMRGKPCTLY